MNQLFSWLIPPLMGAFIGYVTNALAIKMLFRPLRACYLGKIRVPFTPGILPRQRYKLADNIGSMVERDLLTPELLRERLSRADVKAALTSSIASYTEQALNKPLSTVKSAVQVDNPFSRLFRDFFNSPAFDSFVDTLLESILSYLDTSTDLRTQSIKDILGAEQVDTVQEHLEQLLKTQVQAHAQSIAGMVIAVVQKEMPQFTAALIQFLHKKEIRNELESQGQRFLSHVLLKLGTLQRLFFSMGGYNDTLKERMPEIIDDLIAQIEGMVKDKQNCQRFLDFLFGVVERFLSHTDSAHSLAEVLSAYLVRYADVPLHKLLGALSSLKIKDLVASLLHTIRTNTLSASLWAYLFETYQEKSLAEFFSLDPARKEEIDCFLADKILALAQDEISAILSSINIKTLVSDRINALDMIRVERIVLDVMAHQLKWINLFGALLGALIGVSQVLLNSIGR
ncbi:MAG: DUF445 family protein [Spirochaetaceae bacterium]|jgi:uncharacterized membrane protein YheB (UPF0754 family)|nr:DUF445 family protein [Spirochaetaceae bacterium]